MRWPRSLPGLFSNRCATGSGGFPWKSQLAQIETYNAVVKALSAYVYEWIDHRRANPLGTALLGTSKQSCRFLRALDGSVGSLMRLPASEGIRRARRMVFYRARASYNAWPRHL